MAAPREKREVESCVWAWGLAVGVASTIDPALAGIANPMMNLCDPTTIAFEAAGYPLSGQHVAALPETLVGLQYRPF